jgi:hypothetical protein
MRHTPSALALVLLAGAALAPAQERNQVIMEGVGTRGLCGPCLTLWATNVTAHDKVLFQVTDEGAPGSPFTKKPDALTGGLAWLQYRPSGRGTVSVLATVGGRATAPTFCPPPIDPAGECPPPPSREALRIPYGRPFDVSWGEPVTRVALERVVVAPEAHWEHVDVEPRISDDGRQVHFDGAGLELGSYRVQAVARKEQPLPAQLVAIEGRP